MPNNFRTTRPPKMYKRINHHRIEIKVKEIVGNKLAANNLLAGLPT
jgi:hypothetical protein